MCYGLNSLQPVELITQDMDDSNSITNGDKTPQLLAYLVRDYKYFITWLCFRNLVRHLGAIYIKGMPQKLSCVMKEIKERNIQ